MIINILCTRCNTIKKVQGNKNTSTYSTYCTNCRGIPDNTVLFFEEEKKYCKFCPKCNSLLQFKTKNSLRQSVIANSICKSCSSKKSSTVTQEKRRKWQQSLSPEERILLSKKMSDSNKKSWANKSQEDKDKAINHLRKSKNKFLKQLKNKLFKDAWIKNMKKSFEKYCGDNHWMKKPDVYKKVKDSCQKYIGKGHWFNDPEVWERWKKSIKK